MFEIGEKATEKVNKAYLTGTWIARIRKLDHRILDLLYPARCPICDQVASEGFPICPDCRRTIETVKEPVCKKCGKPIENERDEYCRDCGRKAHEFVQGKALWVYGKEVRQSIYRFKYQNRRDYGLVYAGEIAKRYGQWIYDRHIQVIVPIPLHKARKKQRGFNQAQVVAEELGRILGIPVDAGLLVRIRNTRPQKQLNDRERKNNLKKAFKTRENVVELKYILIVDDIYTTGSTMDAVSVVLKAAGAQKIYFCSVGIGKGF